MNRRSFFGLVVAAFVAPVSFVRALLVKRPHWFNKTTGLFYRPASPGDHQRLLDVLKNTCDAQRTGPLVEGGFKGFIGEDDPLPPLFGTHTVG